MIYVCTRTLPPVSANELFVLVPLPQGIIAILDDECLVPGDQHDAVSCYRVPFLLHSPALSILYGSAIFASDVNVKSMLVQLDSKKLRNRLPIRKDRLWSFSGWLPHQCAECSRFAHRSLPEGFSEPPQPSRWISQALYKSHNRCQQERAEPWHWLPGEWCLSTLFEVSPAQKTLVYGQQQHWHRPLHFCRTAPAVIRCVLICVGNFRTMSAASKEH